MRWTTLLLLAGALALAGCARKHKTTMPNGVIVTPSSATSGKVTSVNSSARYAVITYPIGVPLPEVDRRLNVYRAGLKVAEIKITGPSRDLNTVADITTGECQPGDEVREN